MLKQLSILFIVLVLFSCSTSEKAITPEPLKELSEKEKVAFGRAYADGAKAKILENYEESKIYYQTALKINPKHAAANYELGLVYNALKQPQLAFQQFKLATELDPTNYWYKLSYASYLDNANDKTAAIEVYKELVELKPNQVELKYALAQMLHEKGDVEACLKYLNEIEEEIGVNEEISKQKRNIYLSENDVDGASQAIQELIEAYPSELNYYGWLADIYMSNGQEEKAEEVYEQMQRLAPEDYRVQFSMAEYYRTQGKKEEFLKSLKVAFENPSMNIDDKVKYVLRLYQVNSKDSQKRTEAISVCQSIVKGHPEDAKSHALLADFLYFDNQTEQAKFEYQETIKIDSSRFPVWSQLLVILSETNDVAALLDYGKRAVDLFPNQPATYLLYAIGLQQDKQEKKAIEYLLLAKDLVIDNDALLSQIYSSLGDSYHAVDQHEKSDEYYEKSLSLDPNNIYVLNNYSYYLSLRKENLERAKEMSLKSNQLAPGQSSFQDTYAWILYELGQYEEAIEWIDKALQSDGKSPVLLEHKGDILYRLGKQEEAMEYWEKAKANGSDSNELDKKIELKKIP